MDCSLIFQRRAMLLPHIGDCQDICILIEQYLRPIYAFAKDRFRDYTLVHLSMVKSDGSLAFQLPVFNEDGSVWKSCRGVIPSELVQILQPSAVPSIVTHVSYSKYFWFKIIGNYLFVLVVRQMYDA